MPKVCVLGLGYIGLPTAAVLSMHGHQVVGVDIRPDIVEDLKQGKVHIKELGLTAIVRDALRSGNLMLSRDPVPSDVFLICVQTPLDDQKADLRFLTDATRSVVPILRAGNLVIVESTVPPGTTLRVVRPILESSGLVAPQDFQIAYCPERVMPGHVLREIVENDRVVGGIDSRSADRAKELYASFVRGEILTTDCTTAEFVKLIENAYRDVNIAFANELALMAERLGVDVWEAITLANRHPRVNILRPGPGVGGHCLPIDPWFLIEAAGESRIIRAAREVNNLMPVRIVELVAHELDGVEAPRVAVWGVAYKGGVADIRESPAIEVSKRLQERGMSVSVYDPHVPHHEFPTEPLDDSVRDADCVLILTDHREFRYIDPFSVGKEMRRRLLIDTRACVDHTRWQEAGFNVRLLGCAPPNNPPRASPVTT